ncbi:MAG: helix-turn-helix domain-containing protein [Acidimicrobiales bacterium]
MASAGALVSRARRMSNLSASQAARLAGVSTSTVTRVERGEMDPTFSVLERILGACGWRYGERLEPYVDIDALRAARRILDPDLGIPATVGSELYAKRWEEAGIVGTTGAANEATEIAYAASRQTVLSERPGAERFGFKDWRTVARLLEDAGQRWALTGGYAALRYTKVASADWVVFYVDEVGEASAVAGLPPVSGGRSWMTFIPFDEVTAAGTQTLPGGLRLASFWQIVIDCFAGNGRMPAQAEAMIDKALS